MTPTIKTRSSEIVGIQSRQETRRQVHLNKALDLLVALDWSVSLFAASGHYGAHVI